MLISTSSLKLLPPCTFHGQSPALSAVPPAGSRHHLHPLQTPSPVRLPPILPVPALSPHTSAWQLPLSSSKYTFTLIFILYPFPRFFASEKRHSGEECRFSGEIYVLNVVGEILTLDASHCHALDNVLGKEKVYDDNREDRECNRYIHLTHIKLQEVCGTQLSDQDR